jgi:hypothetical protein
VSYPDLSPQAHLTLSVLGKVGDNWSVVAEGYRSWSGEMRGDVEVRFTW